MARRIEIPGIMLLERLLELQTNRKNANVFFSRVTTSVVLYTASSFRCVKGASAGE